MAVSSPAVLLKRLFPSRRPATTTIRVSPQLVEAAASERADLERRFETSAAGLATDEAQRRLEQHGPNTLVHQRRSGPLRLLGHAVANPLVVLLSALSAISFATGDPRAGTVIATMVALGVVLRFVQERRADVAAAKLEQMISVTATAIRGGREVEVPVAQIVPGDVVKLAAGDMVPGDVRVVACKDLFVVQSSLTGESLPVEKFDRPVAATACSPVELVNVAFLGTSVESGSATAIVAATGASTYLGTMAASLAQPPPATSFDKGVRRFTLLMIRFMFVMVPVVFLVNGLTKHDWKEAFFFGLAVAVGLTPEMLPMIVTVCLSQGALAMSRKKAIVKRLPSIQNLGAMDVLCTDKTGTLTLDHVILEKHCDVALDEDDGVLALAYLNSHFQTGLKSVLDRAVLSHQEVHACAHIPEHQKVDEIPFDFQRRVMSVVVRTPEGTRRMITKGAPEAVFARCKRFELDGDLLPMQHVLIRELQDEYEHLSADGFRVLAIAYRDVEEKPAYGRDDERDLVLRGYVAFLDPPKETATAALKALRDHGIALKVLTGDNELVSRKICKEVGLDVDEMVLGAQVEAMSDERLADVARSATLFARISPAHKLRIVKALQSRGHTVGFLGDGINDAPALRAADVGISVDTAVDIAKESADVILLEKSLMVLEEGVLEGRKVFANILKYVRMGASSNFGNMFSVLGASAFVPFLPMTPIQILTNNLLYDLSQTAIPADDVDPEQIAKPRPWSMDALTKFILFVGPCSSIFDYTTYFVMLYLFGCWDPAKASLFQTGWFVESLLTQTLIIHVIRTNKVPFLQSRARWPLLLTSLVIMAIGVALPFSPLASTLGMTRLPPLYWPLLLLTLFCYTLLTQAVKSWLLRRNWI